MDIDRMVDAYEECAAWLAIDRNYESVDASGYTFGRRARAQAKRDCKGFVKYAGSLVEQSGLSAEELGRCFWLSRNRHGAGFIDYRGPVFDALTKAAHTFGSVECVLNRGWLSFMDS